MGRHACLMGFHADGKSEADSFYSGAHGHHACLMGFHADGKSEADSSYSGAQGAMLV